MTVAAILRRASNGFPRPRSVCSRLSSNAASGTNHIITARGDSGANIIAPYVKWATYEAVENTYSGTGSGGTDHKALLDAAISDIHTNGSPYSLLLRFAMGYDSPTWIFTRSTPVRGIPYINIDTPGNAMLPMPDDATYRTLAREAYVDIATWLNTPCPYGGGHTRAAHFVLFTASLPTGEGTEMSFGFNKNADPTYVDTTRTLSAAIQATDGKDADKTITASAYTEFPTGDFVMTLGAPGTDLNSVGILRAHDLFTDTVVDGWGYSRETEAWTISFGTASRFDKASGIGTIALDNTAGADDQRAFINTARTAEQVDLDVLVKIYIGNDGATGTHGAYLTLRRQSNGTGYRFKLRRNNSTNVVRGGVQRLSSGGVGVSTIISEGACANSKTMTGGQYFYWRVQLYNSGGNPTMRWKAWPTNEAEPTTGGPNSDGWGSVATADTNANKVTAGGYVGLGGWMDSDDTRVTDTISFDSFRVNDYNGTEIVAANYDGAGTLKIKSGGRGHCNTTMKDWPAGTAIYKMTDGQTTTLAYDSSYNTGAASLLHDVYATNKNAFRRFYGDANVAVSPPAGLRTVFENAWGQNIDDLMSDMPVSVKIGFAGSGVFDDGVAAAESIGPAKAATYGRRLVCMVTNWDEEGDDSGANSQYDFLVNSRDAGASIGLQTESTTLLVWPTDGDTDGIPDVVEAGEDALVLFGAQLLFFETQPSRFTSATTGNSLAFGGFAGGSGITQKDYFVTLATALQKRLLGQIV